MLLRYILLVTILLSCHFEGTRTYRNLRPLMDGLTLWLDGQDPLATGSPPANGTALSTWKDKSENGNDGDGSGAAPIFTANTLNGLGAVVFDDSKGVDVDLGATNAPFTVFTVCYFNSTNQGPANWDTVYSLGTAAADSHAAIGRHLNNGADKNKYYLTPGDGSYLLGPVLTGYSWLIITQQVLTGASKHVMRLNGVGQSVDAITNNISTNGNIGIGYERTLNDDFLNGTIAEFLFYSRQLTSSEIIAVETYLKNKWGL